jgi:hypothetical protein
MAPLVISTWVWGDKYADYYVSRLQAAIRKHLRRYHRFIVLKPPPGDEQLWKGCLCRLRMFDPMFQRSNGIDVGDRLVCLDLDLVVTGPLDDLFDHVSTFTILQGANASNPCPYNGSVMMLMAGQHADVWSDFSLEEIARRVPRSMSEIHDDQGWLAYKLPGAAAWRVGSDSGIYAFKKPGWPPGDDLPSDARIVCFPGSRDPSQYTHLKWVREHWR